MIISEKKYKYRHLIRTHAENYAKALFLVFSARRKFYAIAAIGEGKVRKEKTQRVVQEIKIWSEITKKVEEKYGTEGSERVQKKAE